MPFEWDPESRREPQKHGVPFEEAETVFDDPCQRLSTQIILKGEEHYLEIGHSSRRRLLW